MVPQNGPQQGRPQQPNQQPGFPSFNSSPSAPHDSSSFLLDAPHHVAKQMAALTAANQARIAQNSRIAPSPLPAPSGTSSGSYLGGINSHSFPPGSHELVPNSASGHANFQMPNNYGLLQTPNSATNNSFLDPSMSQPISSRNQPSTNASLKQRQYAFLQSLANLMSKRGTPLPPQLTGTPSLSYDPSNSPWGIIQPSKEVGSFVLAGKDVDLFKLWGLVLSAGGANAVTSAEGWNAILPHFDLPDEFPSVQANNSASVGLMLSQYYMAILHPFEEMYKKNIQEQKKVHAPQRPGGMSGSQFPAPPNIGRPMPGMPNMQQSGMRPTMNNNGLMGQAIPPANGLSTYPPMHNQHRPTASQNPHQISASDSHSPMMSTDMDSLSHTVDSNLLDQDIQGIKRKHDQGDRDVKRVRQKTDPPENISASMSMALDNTTNNLSHQSSQPPSTQGAMSRTRQQASRRKIEYVPLKRDVETYGGRDIQVIDQEWQALTVRRPLRDINDWGVVDIECICMSIRSRLSIELSYALTTFTVLSTMRGQTPGSGFPIFNCPDLLDDALDLMEELAFGEPEKKTTSESMEVPSKIFTNRELVALVQDTQGHPFASLRPHQGSKDPNLGPQQRPADVIIAVVNIIRNLSTIHDNIEFLSNHPRLMDMLLRLCVVEQVNEKAPAPVSKPLSLSDLLYIRRETVTVLIGIANLINLSANSSLSTTLRMTRRAFELFASYIVDPEECMPPLASIQLAGLPPNANRKPSTLADLALEAFTRFSQNDVNRQIIAKAIPSPTLLLLLESLIHRLPILDADFILMQREPWLAFIEKIVTSVYTIVFLAPYELKQKIKSDRSLAFKHVMLRMAHRVLSVPGDGRIAFSARRVIESIKLLDKAEDSVDTSEPTIPVLSFGMGFLDGGDSGLEKGTGMLGGNRDVAWEMLMMRDVLQDEVTFNELDSLVRVEC